MKLQPWEAHQCANGVRLYIKQLKVDMRHQPLEVTEPLKRLLTDYETLLAKLETYWNEEKQ